MRILMLTPQVPYPPHKGTITRNFNILKNLASRHDMSLLSFGTSADEAAVAELRRHCRDISVVPMPIRSPLTRLWNIFSTTVPDLALRLASQEFARSLASLLQEGRFDIVQIEGLEMARHWETAEVARLPLAASRPTLVFDEHNAEYVLQRRAYEIDRGLPKKWLGALYSFIQWRKLRRYEARFCRKADGVVVVSDQDRRALEAIAWPLRTTVVPNGVDVDYFQPVVARPFPPEPVMVFAGTMDFRPNVDAVIWFAEAILPRIRSEVRHARFVIIGGNPTAAVGRLAKQPGVEITGFVDDVRPLVGSASVYVVPMRFGGGVRFKVVEAMAMGVPVVATSLGCEGVSATPDVDILTADSPDDFAAKTVRLLADAELRQSLGRRARKTAELYYDWRRLVPVLDDFYRQLGSI